MMDMSSSRKYSSDRQSGGGSPRSSISHSHHPPHHRAGHQSPHYSPNEPSLRTLSRRPSDEGLLPPPPPRNRHNKTNDSVSSTGSNIPTRRLCSKCGQPMN